MYKVIKDKDRFALSLGETSQLISMHYVLRLHRALIFFTWLAQFSYQKDVLQNEPQKDKTIT